MSVYRAIALATLAPEVAVEDGCGAEPAPGHQGIAGDHTDPRPAEARVQAGRISLHRRIDQPLDVGKAGLDAANRVCLLALDLLA